MNRHFAVISALALSMTAATAIARPPHLKAMDLNEDGRITRAEAEQAAASRAQAVDSNADGMITVEELQAEHERRKIQRMQKHLTEADTNADGYVQLDEFSSQMLEHIMQRDRDGDGQLSGKELKPKHRHGGRGDKRSPRHDRAE